MSEHTYTVRWHEGGRDRYECSGLDARTAMARLRNALREREYIVVLSVEREAST